MPVPLSVDGQAYVYALCDTDNSFLNVRYVGQTKYPFGRRVQHLQESYSNRTPKQKWIRSLYRRKERFYMLLLERVDLADVRRAEQKWITHFQLLGCDLTN